MDRLNDYDYVLPEGLIAQQPLADRAGSRLMVLNASDGNVSHREFRDFPGLLEAGDVLVVNETRVTALRLTGTRADTAGRVELLVIRRTDPEQFLCLAKPARRLTPGIRLNFPKGLSATVTAAGPHGERTVVFNDPSLPAQVGRTPMPPYIKRDILEPERYQTVYSRADSDAGSAAAPTAGLHFTRELLDAIKGRGVAIAAVSLEVGIDTFRPVQVDDLATHVMHGETCTVSADAADAIANSPGRVVAVGTTTARTLETFARLDGSNGRKLAPGSTTSRLFLRPGSNFQIVDALLTNFHLPRTTMLMMLSAMAGREAVMAAYSEAVRQRYRFLSFGDAMLILSKK
ncbi:MAG: tRNA preQ1(34) S-adenosylmethionine ribosyltransferase-isomerase QueA [Fimbriimonadaceae bacterium]